MIEKVARAIRNTKLPENKFSFDDMSSTGKDMYLNFAKAAIEVMKEPTEGMIRHGTLVNNQLYGYYQDIINSALNGK